MLTGRGYLSDLGSQANGATMDPRSRRRWQEAIGKRESAEADWWAAARQHEQMLDAFNARYEGRPDAPVEQRPADAAPAEPILPSDRRTGSPGPQTDPAVPRGAAPVRQPRARTSLLGRSAPIAESPEEMESEYVSDLAPDPERPPTVEHGVIQHGEVDRNAVDEELSRRTTAERSRIRRLTEAIQRLHVGLLPVPAVTSTDGR